MTRDDILDKYSGGGWDELDTDAMADEIVRLRAQLATVDEEREEAFQVAQANEATARRLNAVIERLRWPTNAVYDAAISVSWMPAEVPVAHMLRAAVAAAEREVGA